MTTGHGRIAGLIATVIWALGCGSTPPCATNSDCPTGYACNTTLEVCVKKAPPDAGPPDSGMQPDYALATEPASVEVVQGQTANVQVNVTRIEGFDEAVTVTVSNVPVGVMVQPLTIAAGEVTGELTFSADTTAAVGSTELGIDGDAGGLKRSAALTLNVAPSPTLTVELKTPAQDVLTNGNVAIEVTVTGAVPEKVEVTKDGAVLTTLTAAPYQYTWDTSAVPEGSYTISAKATLAGKSYAGPVRQVSLDRTAPTLVNRVPAQAAMNVSVNSVLTATFSEPLDPSSLTPSTVNITEGGVTSRSSAVSLSSDQKTLTIVPTVKPTVPAAYSIVFLGLKDKAGNTYAGSPWTFSYPAWLDLGGPLSAESGATRAEQPSLRLDANDNPVVAWSESNVSARNIYVRKWTGTSWQPVGTPLSRTSTAGSDATEPSLRLDGSGNPVVAWSEPTATNPKVFVSRWNGSSWLDVGTGQIGSATSWGATARLALLASGEPFLAWSESDTAPRMYAATWLGSAWSTMSLNQMNGEFNVTGVDLTVDPNDKPVIAYSSMWETSATDWGVEIIVRRWSNGSWTKIGAGIEHAVLAVARSPSIAVDGPSAFAVAWVRTTNNSNWQGEVRAARWNGTSWVQLGTLVNWTATITDSPQIAANAGQIYVAWRGSFSGEYAIGVSKWTGTTWSAVGPSLNAVPGYDAGASMPAIAVDSAGYPVVAWAEDSSTGGDVHVVRFNH